VTRSIIGLIVWVLLCFAVAAFGAMFSPGSTWYAQLQKPSWNPPGWVFGPVWTMLYTMMGVAAWLVWKPEGFAGARLALTLFLVHLIFNGAWSWLFFGLHRADLAFYEITVLWLLIIVTLLAFWNKNTTAGALLIPYLAWVSFASILNFTIWRLNS